jgi:hypothetical protein
VIRLRRALGPLAAAWLVCQVATLTFAPVQFGTGSAGVVVLQCTCSHGDHATCPMHHKPAAGSKHCTMRSTGDSGSGVLSSLLGPLGLIPFRASSISPAPARPLRLVEPATTTLRTAPPDLPPPRA